MKCVSMVCPQCGGALEVSADAKSAECPFCGASVKIDDEALHIQIDNAAQAGYEFESGRIKAKEEHSAKGQADKDHTNRKKKRSSAMFITQAAVIAALYATLTIGQNYLLPGTASAAVQFRVAEVLAVLAIYTPAAIPGLTLGCVIANISSVTAGLGFYDMIFGSTASLLAAITMYLLRNVRIKNIPFLALLMPALFNGVIVGFEIAFFFIEGGFTLPMFLMSGGCVALGELVVMLVLGVPFCVLLNKQGKRMGIVLE